MMYCIENVIPMHHCVTSNQRRVRVERKQPFKSYNQKYLRGCLIALFIDQWYVS